MFKKLYLHYIASFRGLSKEVWWLALVTLINRAGTMVIPFLSLYLTKSLGFSLGQVGWILTSFGLGSVAGAWLGGKLTDKIGYYKVMVWSLLVSGVLFIGLQFFTGFWQICGGIFLVMTAADAFRPAVFVALSAHSAPQNKTRSVTLIRLAINLGFSAGPAIGGIIITTLGYGGLFWVDGLTCLIAGWLLLRLLHPKKAKAIDEITVENPRSAYSDAMYWVFIFCMMLFGFIFIQYFSTVPLFYKDVHQLSEIQIGVLMGLNGLLIAVFEMPIVSYLETKGWAKITNIITGCALTGLSFLLLNLTNWSGILVVGVVLMTVGEMIAFPFSNAFAMQRARNGNAGEYMALYSISFSVAHIFGHNSGMQLIEQFGFGITWTSMVLLCGVCCLILFLLRKPLE
jgi:predicted MFS family arabinose efflux permease